MDALRARFSPPAAVARKAMFDLVQDMYFQTLDEHNARTSGLRRMNRAGYDSDMVRSFLSHARASAGFLANMEQPIGRVGKFDSED